MEERTYSTQGVILARRNFGEADRILTIFSKHYGKIRVIAKGVRRPTSRKRGALEIFNHTKLSLARGRNLDIVTDAEVIDSFALLRKDLIKIGTAYHLCEVVDRLTGEHQEHRLVFEGLVQCLRKLGGVDYWQLYPLTQNFKVSVLEELGFLERGKPVPKDVDTYIEDLINGSLKTKRFLKSLVRNSR